MRDKPTGARGVAYVRISSDKQDMNSQRESVRRWLDQRRLAVQQWYEDVGSRDLAYKRPDFQRLLRAVEAGLVNWIVVDTKDRFGTANAWEFGKFICHLREHDCQLWSVLQGHLTADDAVTEILATVDSVRSRDEQLNKAQRSLRGKIAGIKRGEYQGGFCPFGHDVACYAPDGREKWRVYYTGTYERQKIYPDGRPPERFDGKGNFPHKDEHDILRLAPSCNAERIEVVRKIFRWFATEAITIRGLATRLNNLGIHPVNGEGWYSSRLGPLLRNPVYLTGMTVWNKKGHGRFLEFKDGEYKEVERRKGRARTGRSRGEKDLIFPEREYVGLIDRATWDAVQVKLRGIHRPVKAPRNPALWLAHLMYCGHCGTRMNGWSQRSGQGFARSYTCSIFRKYGNGPGNKTGCQLHRVRSEVIEALVDRYLEETGQKLDLVLDSGAEGRLLEALHTETDAKIREYLQTLGGIYRFVREAGPVPESFEELDGHAC
jgi:DNA invertase Pin-like site-specific DNA recombinase